MRELVLAVKAIWRAWNENEKLDVRGEFYRHTLMTPFFSPPRARTARCESSSRVWERR